MAQGDVGSLPILLGLVVIAIIFQLTNSKFLSPVNLTNLMVQLSAVGTISVGIVLVLLIGEIDLSVGAVSGFTAAIMAVLSVKAGWPPFLFRPSPRSRRGWPSVCSRAAGSGPMYTSLPSWSPSRVLWAGMAPCF